MSLHREGTKIILGTLLILLLLNLSVQYIFTGYIFITAPVLAVSLILLLMVVQFFRLPKRPVEADESLIYCPADGKVVVIEETEENEFFKDKRLQVSIFMSPVNVHVNWHPISGEVIYDKYHPGKYLVAWHPKSSTENERSTVVVEGAKGTILMRQIAGALARRIVTYAKKGQKINQGSEMGFIKFGSRVDVFLPLGTEVLVNLDEKVKGNKTVLARFK
jgi:phosphatidylserine decarboxylase